MHIFILEYLKSPTHQVIPRILDYHKSATHTSWEGNLVTCNYTDYPNQNVLLFRVLHCYNYFSRMLYFTKQSHLCSIMFEQLIELLLVKSELLSKMSLHCVTPNNNMH